MIIPKAKILGLVAVMFGGKVLYEASKGQAVDSATRLSKNFGGSERLALGLSFAIGLIGVIFGLRTLMADRACIGDSCQYDHYSGM